MTFHLRRKTVRGGKCVIPNAIIQVNVHSGNGREAIASDPENPFWYRVDIHNVRMS